MSAVLASRVNYFERQFIRLAEMRDEQAYHRQLHRRHNLSHHSWGIVAGLELVIESGQPVVRPGFAVDGYGRDLLLVDRGVFRRDDFDRLGTARLDLWLEYQLDIVDDPASISTCDVPSQGDGARQPYRAIERAAIVAVRGGTLPDPRAPPGVPATALDEPLLDTPDDPRQRWPVYLGRIVMSLPASGEPVFIVDSSNRVYAGVNAATLDHPGNASRVELGRMSTADGVKQIGDDTYRYAAVPRCDFAVFVPEAGDDAQAGTTSAGPPPLQPTLAISGDSTQVRGTTRVHGNLVMDGASLQFSQPTAGQTQADPSIYRIGDELRIDVGSLQGGKRALVVGVMNGGDFLKALEVRYDDPSGEPVVVVHGDLHIEGTIDSSDTRTRTVTGDVATLLTGMVQAAIAAA